MVTLKAYFWRLGRYRVETVFEKGFYRWYSTVYKYNLGKGPVRDFRASFGSNALTHWGAIRQTRKHFKELENEV